MPRFRLLASTILSIALIGCNGESGSAVGSPSSYAPSEVLVLNNAAPPGVSLQLDPEPLLVIGGKEATGSQLLHDVTSAKRLSDGGVAVAASGNYEIRRFDSKGRLVWQAGREGVGPGEFRSLWLLRGCSTDDTLIVHDLFLRRLTVFDGDGTLVDTQLLEFKGARPYTLSCSPSSRIAMTSWGDLRAVELGPFRWSVSVAYTDIGSRTVTVLRDGVPGADRVQYESSNGPRTWGRNTIVGATHRGTWLGTGDSYELEFLNWRGDTLKKIRWGGPDLMVSEGHITSYRESRYPGFVQRYSSNPGPVFERWWKREREYLPQRFPAFSRIFVLLDGSLWVERYPFPGSADELWFFDVDGRWTQTLRLPPRTSVLDVGTTWVVVLATDDLGVQSVRAHTLVPGT